MSATGGRLVSFYTRCLLVSDIECVLFVSVFIKVAVFVKHMVPSWFIVDAC